VKVCDWIACLRPPEPPPDSNLRLTDWFGAPVSFNQTARYFCNRGMQFEQDPTQEYIEYTCQVRNYNQLEVYHFHNIYVVGFIECVLLHSKKKGIT
jgi:hypothetical protein